MMPKKVLITGVTGMVGSHLLDYLLGHTDWEITGMLRWRSPLDNITHHLPRINAKDRIKLVYADLRDTMSVEHAVVKSRPDYVFHLAAQSYPKTSFDSPLDTLDTNIQGTERLLGALRKYAKDAIIHVCASSEVFGRVSQEQLPIDEECTFHPASPYAISKVGTDLVGRYYAEAYDMCVMTTRMFTHTGPRRGDVFAESTFAKQISMIEKGLIPPVVNTGNLDSLRTWADVRDAVRAYYMLVTHNPIPGEYYNIGGSFTLSVKGMLDKLISLSTMANQITTKIDPDRLRPIDADLQVPDTRKFTAHTGWKPEISFEKTMQDLLDYWHSRLNSAQNFLTR
ncbi:GDP-mannose 4,6-dehydratase [Yersinia alsatica]|uniref:GDP-mannose 4,6-dehydratase n=1 Tax=Yersinia alsatica TaxID=2890317 RepID=A0ABY5UNV3_9GAMM|nr:GDP-mannose 4,6-dehydratase [Yersinia alsatica]UWM44425.1 GDP-mannose 4,6-dehydratase [Yersinia alsatica]CNK84006.1 NAD-dependent epimerase/dehydratase [Yersinia frederiksenii]CNK92301.1 NAD-dependent epimerase/dehydratase [Yersinia frederiksenii]